MRGMWMWRNEEANAIERSLRYHPRKGVVLFFCLIVLDVAPDVFFCGMIGIEESMHFLLSALRINDSVLRWSMDPHILPPSILKESHAIFNECSYVSGLSTAADLFIISRFCRISCSRKGFVHSFYPKLKVKFSFWMLIVLADSGDCTLDRVYISWGYAAAWPHSSWRHVSVCGSYNLGSTCFISYSSGSLHTPYLKKTTF
jgi:hypothetical protein